MLSLPTYNHINGIDVAQFVSQRQNMQRPTDGLAQLPQASSMNAWRALLIISRELIACEQWIRDRNN